MKIAMIIGGVGSRVGIPGVWRPDIREGERECIWTWRRMKAKTIEEWRGREDIERIIYDKRN
jgi:hypothetical protein